MLEANVGVLLARKAGHRAEILKSEKILLGFLQTRSNLNAVNKPMTGPQKLATLTQLTQKQEEEDVARLSADEVFNATEPILIEGGA